MSNEPAANASSGSMDSDTCSAGLIRMPPLPPRRPRASTRVPRLIQTDRRSELRKRDANQSKLGADFVPAYSRLLRKGRSLGCSPRSGQVQRAGRQATGGERRRRKNAFGSYLRCKVVIVVVEAAV